MTENEWYDRADEGDGLFAVACGLLAMRKAIDKLGTADAATPLGALEHLAMEVRDGFEKLSDSISAHAGAINELAERLEPLSEMATHIHGIDQELGPSCYMSFGQAVQGIGNDIKDGLLELATSLAKRK